jgi:hypothetical protein
MNYITIDVLGKQRLFRFDMYAMELLYDENKVSFPGKLGSVAKMLYAGLASGCNAKGKENDFTREEILDMLDEMATTQEGKKQIELISNCFIQSQAYKAILKEGRNNEETDEQKKSLNGATSGLMLLEK